jgi:outer membrane protein
MNLRYVRVFTLAALWLGITCLVGSNVLAAESKQIVIVNTQEVLMESLSGKAAAEKFEEKLAEFQDKIQSEQKAVEALRDEIEKKSSVWSQQVKEEKERDYQKKVRELQLKSEDSQFELQQLQKQLIEPVAKELQKVIADVGKEKGYAMIIDSRAGLLYVDDALDISEIVRKELDSRHKAK